MTQRRMHECVSPMIGRQLGLVLGAATALGCASQVGLKPYVEPPASEPHAVVRFESRIIATPGRSSTKRFSLTSSLSSSRARRATIPSLARGVFGSPLNPAFGACRPPSFTPNRNDSGGSSRHSIPTISTYSVTDGACESAFVFQPAANGVYVIEYDFYGCAVPAAVPGAEASRKW